MTSPLEPSPPTASAATLGACGRSFGRDGEGFTWESTAPAGDLRAAVERL